MKKSDSLKSLSLSDMSDQIKNERIYRRIENFYDVSSRNAFYSMQRIDLIIIALSTGGIIVLLNFYKFNLENCIENNPLLLWSMALFMITIGCNLVGQWLAYKIHIIGTEWAESQMDYLNEDEEVKDQEIKEREIEEEREDRKSETYNIIRNRFDNLSYLLLIFACILFFCLLL